MKKVLAVLVVLAIGGWLCYANGVFSMVTDGKLNPDTGLKGAEGEALKGDPYELVVSGDYAQARDILHSRMEGGKGESVAQDLKYLGLAYRGLKDKAKARDAWQTLLKEHPTSGFCGDACFGLAEICAEEGNRDEQVSYLKKAMDKYPDSDGGARAALVLGKTYLEAGEKCKARKAFSKALPAATAEEKTKIKEILSQLNTDIIFSPIPNEHAPVYCVRGGDSLGRIARKFGTTIGLIKSVNRLEGNTIFPGDRLKIVKGTVHLEAYKSLFVLSLYIDDVWIQDFPIGIGANDKTPEGEFIVETKIINPPWHFRGKVYPPGHPENVLGSRWMGFRNKPGFYGFGIHGTSDPNSVGGAVSRGCLRMLNKDIEKLFEIVPRKTKVIIRK